MSTYYNYYLEQKVSDGWGILKNVVPDISEEGEDTIYWHTGSFGREFPIHYQLRCIPFEDYSIEMKKQYQSAYDKVQDDLSFFGDWYPRFEQLDLVAMIRDFNDNVHERDGIISKNQYLKLQRDSEYEPDVITPKDFNKLPARIQENYLYHSWDSPWSEFGPIYIIVPIVLKMLEFYNLRIEDVRLTYFIS